MEYINSAVREAIAEHIHSQRDREVISRKLIDGISIEKIAEEFDLSVSQTKRIIQKGRETVFHHMP